MLFLDLEKAKKSPSFLPRKTCDIEDLVEEIVYCLKEKGKEVLNLSFTEYSTFKEAGDSKEIKKKLLSEVLSNGSEAKSLVSAIFNAVHQGDIEMVELLLEKEPEAQKLNSTTECDISPILLAAQRGETAIVEHLYKNGGTVKNEGTLIFHAYDRNRKGVLRSLQEMGVNLHSKMRDNMSPLQYSIKNNELEKAQSLLELGVDPKEKPQWDYAPPPSIFMVAEEGSVDFIKLFHLHDQSILSSTNHKGWNLLHIAATFGHQNMVEFLCEKGIDPYDTTVDGKTALQLASKYGHTNTHSYLLMN
ncbi:MAG: ankyrin repeat protein [Chlamydiales bacterium]